MNAVFPNSEKTCVKWRKVLPHVSPCPKKSSEAHTSVIPTRMRQTSFQALRQKALRRRLTTSSARSSGLSAPNRLGDSMKRRKATSTRPRNAATSITVSSSAYRSASPSCTRNQTNATGEVRSATIVAARVSDRHWLPRSCARVPAAETVPASVAIC